MLNLAYCLQCPTVFSHPVDDLDLTSFNVFIFDVPEFRFPVYFGAIDVFYFSLYCIIQKGF